MRAGGWGGRNPESDGRTLSLGRAVVRDDVEGLRLAEGLGDESLVCLILQTQPFHPNLPELEERLEALREQYPKLPED